MILHQKTVDSLSSYKQHPRRSSLFSFLSPMTQGGLASIREAGLLIFFDKEQEIAVICYGILSSKKMLE